jgi:hypothetical protein
LWDSLYNLANLEQTEREKRILYILRCVLIVLLTGRMYEYLHGEYRIIDLTNPNKIYSFFSSGRAIYCLLLFLLMWLAIENIGFTIWKFFFMLPYRVGIKNKEGIIAAVYFVLIFSRVLKKTQTGWVADKNYYYAQVAVNEINKDSKEYFEKKHYRTFLVYALTYLIYIFWVYPVLPSKVVWWVITSYFAGSMILQLSIYGILKTFEKKGDKFAGVINGYDPELAVEVKRDPYE